MTKKISENKIKFGIKKISILDYSIGTSNLSVLNTEPIKFRFEFNVNFTLNPSENELIYDMNLKVIPEPDHDIVLGTLKIEIRFFVENIVNFLNADKTQINLPDVFMATLIGIVISTARGIWASKVMGTKLEKAVLPIINPHDFIKSMKKAQNKFES